MSSCAASCSTCCRAASCASATSASSPTDNAPGCCHSASSRSQVLPTSRIERHRPLQITPARPPTGTVPSAEAPCMSSNGSPPLNCCRVLHLSPVYVPHETATSTSISPRARTRIPPLRLIETLAPTRHPNHHLRLPQDQTYSQSPRSRPTRSARNDNSTFRI